MNEEENYNAPLRSFILICSIRAEKAASEVVKSMLRTVKDDSKTLSNKSSSLSFKNKIDLLYDIDDIDKEDYNCCIKFMEIRNQFTHNPNCSYFIDLEIESPTSLTFLQKNFPNQEKNKEEGLKESFEKLWIRVMGRLLILKSEYDNGVNNDLLKFIDSKALKALDEICTLTYYEYLNSEITVPPLSFLNHYPESQFLRFEQAFKNALNRKRVEIIESIKEGKFTEKELFDRKQSILKEINKKDES